jgi:hypothetical protein
VKEIDIDIVGFEPLQALLQAALEFTDWIAMFRWWWQFLGRNDHLIARHFPERFSDNGLGAIGLSGIKQVDAQIERLPYYRDRFLFALAGSLAQAAGTTTAETNDTDP